MSVSLIPTTRLGALSLRPCLGGTVDTPGRSRTVINEANIHPDFLPIDDNKVARLRSRSLQRHDFSESRPWVLLATRALWRQISRFAVTELVKIVAK